MESEARLYDSVIELTLENSSYKDSSGTESPRPE